MLTVKINEYSYPLFAYFYNISYGEDQQIINNTMSFEIESANQRVEEL